MTTSPFALHRVLTGVALFFTVGMAAAWSQDGDNRRLVDLRQQIAETEEILVEITNEVDRAEWQQRLDLLQLDHDMLQEKLKIAREESTLERRRRQSHDQVLRETLRTINVKTEVLRDDIERLDERTRELRADRARLEDERRRLQDANDLDDEDIVEVDLRIRNKDEEVAASLLAREAAELRLQLAEHAVRIDTMLKERPISIKPTIQNIMRDQRYIEGEHKRMDDMRVQLTDLRTALESHRQALALTRAKKEHIDSEIALLQQRSKGLSRLRLALVAPLEKKMLAERVALQEQQVASAEESVRLALRMIELLGNEIDLFSEQLDELITRSWQRVVIPAAVIVAIIILSWLISRVILPLFFKQDRLFIARRLGGYLVLLLAILTIALFFMEDLRAIAVFMGIAGAALVIALQDLVSSFVGWFVIISSRKLGVGDRVEIDEHRGDVIDVQLLRTTLIELNNWLGVDEPTGRILIIPNSFIFKSKVLNYAHVHPCLWGHIDVTVTYETPAKKALDTLLQILTEESREEFEEARAAAGQMERRYGVPDTVYQPKVYSFIADSGVLYRLLYVAHYRRFSSTRTRINNRIIEVFDKDPELDFAYPTERHIPTPSPGGFQVRMDGGAPSPDAQPAG